MLQKTRGPGQPPLLSIYFILSFYKMGLVIIASILLGLVGELNKIKGVKEFAELHSTVEAT